MTWSFRVPHYGDSDAPISDIVEAARAALDGDDRRVAEQLAWDALHRGTTRVGGLLDELEQAGPHGRRQIFDDAREAVGLERSEVLDDAARFRLAQQTVGPNSSGRDQEGKAIQVCGAEGCKAMSADPATGALTAVPDRQWWCGEHRDQAGPEDHLPPDDVWTLGPHFELVPSPSEQRRMQAEDDRHREEREREKHGRRAEAETIEAARRRYAEQTLVNDYVRPKIAGIEGARMEPR